eukprot:1751037-Prymnesium_polylepis.1
MCPSAVPDNMSETCRHVERRFWLLRNRFDLSGNLRKSVKELRRHALRNLGFSAGGGTCP